MSNGESNVLAVKWSHKHEVGLWTKTDVVDIQSNHSSQADVSWARTSLRWCWTGCKCNSIEAFALWGVLLAHLLDVPSLWVEIKAALMKTAYRLIWVENWKSSFNYRELHREYPAWLWNAPHDEIKIHLLEDVHYKVNIPDRKEWEDGFGPNTGLSGLRTDERLRTVLELAVNGQRIIAFSDWTTATPCFRRKFSQSRNVRGYCQGVALKALDRETVSSRLVAEIRATLQGIYWIVGHVRWKKSR